MGDNADFLHATDRALTYASRFLQVKLHFFCQWWNKIIHWSLRLSVYDTDETKWANANQFVLTGSGRKCWSETSAAVGLYVLPTAGRSLTWMVSVKQTSRPTVLHLSTRPTVVAEVHTCIKVFIGKTAFVAHSLTVRSLSSNFGRATDTSALKAQKGSKPGNWHFV